MGNFSLFGVGCCCRTYTIAGDLPTTDGRWTPLRDWIGIGLGVGNDRADSDYWLYHPQTGSAYNDPQPWELADNLDDFDVLVLYGLGSPVTGQPTWTGQRLSDLADWLDDGGRLLVYSIQFWQNSSTFLTALQTDWNNALSGLGSSMSLGNRWCHPDSLSLQAEMLPGDIAYGDTGYYAVNVNEVIGGQVVNYTAGHSSSGFFTPCSNSYPCIAAETIGDGVLVVCGHSPPPTQLYDWASHLPLVTRLVEWTTDELFN